MKRRLTAVQVCAQFMASDDDADTADSSDSFQPGSSDNEASSDSYSDDGHE